MRMLLTSGTTLQGSVLQTLADLIGKPLAEARTVVVLDAMLPLPGDKSQMLEHLAAYRALGWAECDILSLLAGPPALVESRLRGADVIFCYGGTNHWLAHAWRASGLAPVLRELLDTTVYYGVSAGSMIFSRRHSAIVEALSDHSEVEMLGLDEPGPALPLLDWSVVPHLGADFFPHQTDEWASRIAPRFGEPTWFLDDRSAVLVRDPQAEPEVVSDGHWLHFDAAGRLVASR